MKPPQQKLIAIGLLTAVVLFCWVAFRAPRELPFNSPRRVDRNKPMSTNGASAPKAVHSSDHAPRASEHRDRFHKALYDLENASDADGIRRALAELRSYLTALPAEIASAAIRDFLNGQVDKSTRLEFAIGPDGNLKDAPTLRIFLLDLLSGIDQQAAAEYARTILNTHGSADEWALSLRNYARAKGSPEDQAFLLEKMREMINYAPWQRQPSAGFLEAFDTIVHVRGTSLTPPLAQLVSNKENRAVAHAAYLTLDRLVLVDPPAVLRQLLEEPELMKGREQTRANYFARADVRHPEQRQLVENYLLDPRRTTEELRTFAGLFPNANYMISNNLLTSTATPDHAELNARDRAALEVVQAWLADPRFAKVQSQLAVTRSRLETFVNQASARPGE